ncbi:hypothetical protein Dcar01_02391 [Deinococcus carri]|uniref:Uncharacterized protein n=1 Tax=Deinococcus carri TaxID=1211323 RepID=A0ABP9W8G9_9DEIO
MPVWRDRWDGTPNVAVISETPVTEEGTVEDALLFVLDESPQRVALTDEHGASRTFTLPSEALEGTFFKAGLDLPTEPQQENPQ